MSSPDQRSMGVEYRIRASPTSSPEEIVNQLVAQLVPYLRQVFSQYTVVYRVRVIIQPVFVAHSSRTCARCSASTLWCIGLG